MRRARASASIVDGKAERISKNLDQYRRQLMTLPHVDARHRDEFWDLAYVIERGDTPAELFDNEGSLEIHWYGFRIVLSAPWQSWVDPVEGDWTPGSPVHFDVVANYLRHAHDRTD